MLFNNAFICVSDAAEKMSCEKWRKVLDVNSNGAFSNCTRSWAQHDLRWTGRKHHKRCLNVWSNCQLPPGTICLQRHAKAALIYLTKSLAVEWAKYGIGVNALSPGYIETTITLTAPKVWRDQWVSMPLKRMGSLAKLQGAAVCRASRAPNVHYRVSTRGGWKL